jgi:hypothetical protein
MPPVMDEALATGTRYQAQCGDAAYKTPRHHDAPKSPCLRFEVMGHIGLAGDNMPAQEHHRYTSSPSQVDPPAASL